VIAHGWHGRQELASPPQGGPARAHTRIDHMVLTRPRSHDAASLCEP